MSVSLFGVCSIHSGYCTGEGIRVDIQIPVHHGNLLGGQQPCTQIKVENLNVCSRCNKTLGMLSWSMATIQDRRS